MKTKKIIALVIVIIVIAAGIGIWLINANNNNNLNSNANINNNKYEENNVASIKENAVNEDNTEDREKSDNNITIIYFSATGTTRKVAEYIKELTGGDLIEIVPKQKYTNDDLNYSNNNSRATKEQNDSSARPEIANTIDTEPYDVIYLGYPIWWENAPKIILTFLDESNLKQLFHSAHQEALQ